MNRVVLEYLFNKRNEIIARFISDVMSSEYFTIALERVLTAGGYIDEKVQVALNTFRVASKRELEDMQERLVHMERKLRRIEKSIGELREDIHRIAQSAAQESETSQTPLEKPAESQCPVCGKSFKPRNIHQKFCSAACRSKSI